MNHSSAFGDGGAFRAIFFEEAQEHLAGTEAILLRLDTDAPSSDDLNAIFRAVHSIKGSAAMLGLKEIAALTHVFENLLDLLRKGERGMDRADVDAMLEAGDIVKSQVAHHRGLLPAAPDGSLAEARLRERVAVPSASGVAGPRRRNFSVRLGPLAQAIDAAELEMMLAGLAEMGSVANPSVDNRAGGLVCFDVGLEGSEMDLRSVLALVVSPEQIAVQTSEGSGTVPAGISTSPPEDPGSPPAQWAPAQHEANEIFVDRAELRRSKAAPAIDAVAPQIAPMPRDDNSVELFVTPEHWKDRRAARAEKRAEAMATAAARSAATVAPEAVAMPLLPSAGSTHSVPEVASGSGFSGGSIRVATEKIDLLVNLVGELVITESMLSNRAGLNEQATGHHQTGLADLARHTRDLQEMVLSIRMVPIADVFARLPRLVRELSTRLGKRVDLKMSGEATELDRGLIEKISDPLNHLVRNCVDHGLETPEARVAAGKPPVGTVTLAASQRGGKVVIEVSDDGRGLNRELILRHAAKRGRIVPADAPDSEIWPLLFEAGFSTAEKVTDVSGRGVGMDVVRRNIQSLGGSVEIASREGQGLKVTMTVPLTLAIVEAMTVLLGSQTYVLPLAQVIESRSLAPGEIHALPGERETLAVRGSYLPVLRLSKLFPPAEPREHGDGIAVLVEAEGACAAVLVDALLGQQPVVVKSLETNFRKVPGVSGATIMSDGSVALILDVAHLIRSCGSVQVVRSESGTMRVA